jgi:hypothetical protein
MKNVNARRRSRTGFAFLLPLSAIGILTACFHTGQPAGSATEPPDSSGMMAMCPMTVPGTQVYAADTANGEALTFTTSSPDQVAELRIRVHAMANMHNQRHGGMGGGEGMGGAGMGGGKMMMPPPSHAWVEDVENGARISMTPNDAADLQKLQGAVRMHAEHMQRHGCAMGP